MKNLPLLIGTLLITVLMVVGVVVLFSQPAEPEGKVEDSILYQNARLQKGSATARVRIVEFSDFQCPACKASAPLVKQVLEKYPNDVQLIYRHFPLRQIHQYAGLTAQFSEAAATEGKFWEAHDILFATQEQWSQLSNEKAVEESLLGLLSAAGIDKAALSAKIRTDETQQYIKQDELDATRLKVQATPTFFVNGVRTSAPELLQTVEAALKQ